MGDKHLGSTVGNQDNAAQAEPARPQPLPRRAPRPDLARLRDTPALPPALTTAAALRCDLALGTTERKGEEGGVKRKGWFPPCFPACADAKGRAKAARRGPPPDAEGRHREAA